MKRGEIYWADLAPRSGSEQSGRRPVLVVSHDAFNQTTTWRSVVVVPISTSKAQGRRGPTAVELPSASTGLTRASIAVCHQVTTLDRTKLTKYVATVASDQMRAVDDGIRAALDLDT